MPSLFRHSRTLPLPVRPTLLSISARLIRPPLALENKQPSASKTLTFQRPLTNVSQMTMGLVGKRFLHSSAPRRMPPIPNGPPFKVYRASPFMVLLVGVGFFMLLFAVLPFIFTFFFPLIIAGICAYQFSKWKRRSLFQLILKRLKASTMKVNSNTVKALHIKSLDRIVKVEQKHTDMFQDLLKSFDADLRARLDKTSSANADKLLSYLDDRLLEAMENNEEGIRSYFLGDDVNSWVEDNYELELYTKQYKTNAQIVDGELVMLLTFPLYLKSNSNPRKHLANVSLAILQKTPTETSGANYLDFLSSISKNDSECPMLIAVQPVTNLSTKLFIMSTEGRSGDWHSKFDAKQDSSGHTEYTVRSNN